MLTNLFFLAILDGVSLVVELWCNLEWKQTANGRQVNRRYNYGHSRVQISPLRGPGYIDRARGEVRDANWQPEPGRTTTVRRNEGTTKLASGQRDTQTPILTGQVRAHWDRQEKQGTSGRTTRRSPDLLRRHRQEHLNQRPADIAEEEGKKATWNGREGEGADGHE